MPDSNLTQGDTELQRLQAVRREQLSCLFDADSTLRALPPTPVKPTVPPVGQKSLTFPNHNPIVVDSTAAAMAALGKSRRRKPGGSKVQGQPAPLPTPSPTATPPVPRLPTEAELAALYGKPQASLPVQSLPQAELGRQTPARRVTLVSLWRRARHFVRTRPRFMQELAQHVAFVVLGGSIRFFAPSPAAVPIVMGLAFLTIVCLFLFRPGWREQRLTGCLLLGLCLSSFL